MNSLGKMRAHVAASSNESSFKSRSARGQVAVEFMLYLAVFMVVLIAGYVVVLYVQGTELPFKEGLVVKETGQTFISAVSLVKKGGAGFEYVVSLPVAMFGHNYELVVNDGSDSVVINALGSSQNITFSYPLPSRIHYFSDDPQGTCVRQDGDFMYVQSEGCNGLIKISNVGKENGVGEDQISISPYGEAQ